MKNEITITTDRLGELLAASCLTNTQSQHDATCSAFRWMVSCLFEKQEEAEKFYDAACFKATQVMARKTKTIATTETDEGKIVCAILRGCHKTENIMKEMFEATEYRQFCDAIASLQKKGLVVCTNENMAHEWGYFLTDKAYQQMN